MCIQRETGAHRAVKVIKRKILNKEDFAGRTREEEDEMIKEHEKSVEKELMNEVQMLCKLVGFVPSEFLIGSPQHCSHSRDLL